jgi:hypothetical protein
MFANKLGEVAAGGPGVGIVAITSSGVHESSRSRNTMSSRKGEISCG